MNVEICQTDLFNAELIALISQLDAYQEALYPAEGNHAEPIESMRLIKNFAYVAKLEGQAVGCAILFLPDNSYPEIKRVFIVPEYRGFGVASLLVTTIINKSNTLSLNKIYLETGIYQPSAAKLYQRLGFELTSEFGGYQYDPLSVYMVRFLAMSNKMIEF
ncbi:GNAT family N-acetyltransferase [Yersinia aleksiciae]|uniref:GNAT family N-acetyltransferase n=1 Tax=Yersinia aleksiciae TaxID=263819 RepID=UPI0011A87F2B|nr:GNAT family N-acetyltransferase [Yersinia aleksiciae]